MMQEIASCSVPSEEMRLQVAQVAERVLHGGSGTGNSIKFEGKV